MGHGNAEEFVSDSEGEIDQLSMKPDLPTPEMPQVQISSISEFTSKEMSKLTKTSSISQFTEDRVKAASSTATTTNTSSSVVKPRVRPRPAYKKAALQQPTPSKDVSSLEQISTAGPSHSDPCTYIQDISERTKMRSQRSAVGQTSHSDPISNSTKRTRNVIDLSSNDEYNDAPTGASGVSLSNRRNKISGMRDDLDTAEHRLPSSLAAADTSILPPSEPPTSSSFVHITRELSPILDNQSGSLRPSSTPESRQKKRKHQRDVDESFNLMDVDPHEPGGSTKKGKKRAGQKSKTKKGQDDIASKANVADDSAPKSRQPRGKRGNGKETQQGFKSKEIIDDSSDDELILGSRPDPASIAMSDPPTISVSVPPSHQISCQPSITKSIEPSLDRSVFATAVMECVEVTARSKATKNPTCTEEDISLNEEIVIHQKRLVKGKKVAMTIANEDKEQCAEGGVHKAKLSKKGAGKKKRQTILSDEDSASEEEKTTRASDIQPLNSSSHKHKLDDHEGDKENDSVGPEPLQIAPVPSSSATPAPRPSNVASSRTPRLGPRKGSVSDLIRRVSSKVNSPLASPSPAYSPLAKSSRAVLSRIAPLHISRRTPPPPLPRAPPPRKTKKMLDLEEKWEMELAESVEGWSCMSEEERAALFRAKRDRELGFDD